MLRVLILGSLIFGQSQVLASSRNCAKATNLVGENWELVTVVSDLCEDPFADKQEVRELGNDVFDNVKLASKECMTACASVPKNYKFCQKSYRQAEPLRQKFLSNCN